MVTRNKGYGNSGEGGPGGDAASINTTNPNLSRTQSPQGSPPTVSTPLPILEPTTAGSDDFAFEQYIFQAQVNDLIVCHAVTLEEGVETEGQDNINIAKPPQFRKSEIDGVTIDGETFTYAPDNFDGTPGLQGTRKREIIVGAATVAFLEEINPPYIVGEKIFATRAQATGIVAIELIDANLQARRWVDQEPLFKDFAIQEIEKDYFNCYPVIAGVITPVDPADLTVFIKVAKPRELQGSTWENLAWYDGEGEITYTDETAGTTYIERTAIRDQTGTDPFETHVITPPYIIDGLGVNGFGFGGAVGGLPTGDDGRAHTIIKAMRMDQGTEVDDIIWQDMNQGGHAWSEFFTGPQSI